MRKNGFDRIKVITDRHEETRRRMHAGLDPEPFYTALYNPRKEFILDMKIEVESLRLELLLSRPLLPQLLSWQSPARRNHRNSRVLLLR